MRGMQVDLVGAHGGEDGSWDGTFVQRVDRRSSEAPNGTSPTARVPREVTVSAHLQSRTPSALDAIPSPGPGSDHYCVGR